ncbi:DUF6368 family protein [Microbulbifer sp. SSSA002]|uniref:DUF6368 family protein n=1 Tax=Microbulbifer sp. SSSA002 TaxID=3243376 RepID=UPI004039B6C0
MGPISDIIVGYDIDDGIKKDFVAFVQELGGEFHGNGILYKGRSFLFGFGWNYPEEIKEYSHLQGLASIIAKNKIHISANCNDLKDHKCLAELCYAVCSKFKGVVEFCDDLNDRTDDDSLASHPQHYNNGYTSQLGPDLMKIWLHHDDFHMVK